MDDNIIFEHWRVFRDISSKKRQAYFDKKIKDGHTIKCVSIKDIFTSDEINIIKNFCQIEPKMCFRTAYRLTQLLPERVKYVEGEVTILNGGLGIEHAWNLIDDKYYVDLTFELALGEDVTKETYVALGEYDFDVIHETACDIRIYGSVYDYRYWKEIKNNKSKTKKH